MKDLELELLLLTQSPPLPPRGAGASVGSSPNLEFKVLEYNNIYKSEIEVLEQ